MVIKDDFFFLGFGLGIYNFVIEVIGDFIRFSNNCRNDMRNKRRKLFVRNRVIIF